MWAHAFIILVVLIGFTESTNVKIEPFIHDTVPANIMNDFFPERRITFSGFVNLALAVDRWQNHQIIGLASVVDQQFRLNFETSEMRAATGEDLDVSGHGSHINCSSVVCTGWFLSPREYRNDFLYTDEQGIFLRCCPGNAVLAIVRSQICSGLPITNFHNQRCCIVIPEVGKLQQHWLNSGNMKIPTDFVSLDFHSAVSTIESLMCTEADWGRNFQVLWDQGIVGGQHRSFVESQNRNADRIDKNHRLMDLEKAIQLRKYYESVTDLSAIDQRLFTSCFLVGYTNGTDCHRLDDSGRPLFGLITMWEVIEKLAQTFDRSDSAISIGTSQFLHCMQVFEGMLADPATEEWHLVAALLHDVGKVLSLTGEDDENVDGSNHVLWCPHEGCGLDACVLTYSHDEFGYQKLRRVLPDGVPHAEEILYTVRYHSLHSVDEKWLSEKDRKLFPWLFEKFHVFDHGTKNPAHVPDLKIFVKAQELIHKWFPEKILF